MAAPARAQTPVAQTFTYQGRLMEAGSPADGAYDFRFQLYDAPDGGSQVGPTTSADDVFVSTGLFTVGLNFGASFTGQNRFLEVAVRPGSSTGSYETVSGRHTLTPSPMALVGLTAPWAGVLSKPPGFADDVDNDRLGGLVCAPNQLAKWNGSTWACANDIDTNTTYTVAVNGGLALTGTAFSITTAGVTTARLADGAVTNPKLADLSVTGSKIPIDTITAAHITVGAVGADELAADSVGSSELATGSVGATEIADGAVGAPEIAANAVGFVELADDSVGAGEIMDNSIGLAEMADNSVGSAEIVMSAVGTSEIADGAVARADLGGTEVALYQNISECGSTVLTLSTICLTTVCSTAPPLRFYECSGACTSPGPVQCNTTLRGYLLGTAIP